MFWAHVVDYAVCWWLWGAHDFASQQPHAGVAHASGHLLTWFSTPLALGLFLRARAAELLPAGGLVCCSCCGLALNQAGYLAVA